MKGSLGSNMRHLPKIGYLATLFLVLAGPTQCQVSTDNTGGFDAASCGLVSAPSWCAGSDIGAWVNAAIAKGAASVFIGPGTFNQTTTIMLPRTVRLRGAAAYHTVLNWTPPTQSGWAIVVADSGGGGVPSPRGGIEDLTLTSPSNVAQNGLLYLGGSDGITGGAGAVRVGACTTSATTCNVTYVSGTQFNTSWSQWQPIIINGARCLISSVTNSTALTVLTPCGAKSGTYYVTGSPLTSIDPGKYYGDNVNINRVRMLGAGVAVQWGNNSWLQSFMQFEISANGTGIYFPATITNANPSGENPSFYAGVISNNGFGLVLGKSGIGDVDFKFDGVSFGYNSEWAVANGSANAEVDISQAHFEQVAQFITSYGPLHVSNTYMTNGGSSGTLGYLIDPEHSWCGFVNVTIFNGGKGTAFNPAGQACTLTNVAWNGRGLGNPPGYRSDPANVLPTAVLAAKGITSQSFSAPSYQGVELGWNLTGSTGEADFVNNHGGGSGGWDFYDCSGVCGSQTIAYAIDAKGTVRQVSSASPTSSTGTVVGTNNGGYVSGLSSATALTLTFANGGWGTWASCNANTSASASQPYISAISKSAVTFKFPDLTGTLYYSCTGS
jgi:hypothetical protein